MCLICQLVPKYDTGDTKTANMRRPAAPRRAYSSSARMTSNMSGRHVDVHTHVCACSPNFERFRPARTQKPPYNKHNTLVITSINIMCKMHDEHKIFITWFSASSRRGTASSSSGSSQKCSRRRCVVSGVTGIFCDVPMSTRVKWALCCCVVLTRRRCTRHVGRANVAVPTIYAIAINGERASSLRLCTRNTCWQIAGYAMSRRRINPVVVCVSNSRTTLSITAVNSKLPQLYVGVWVCAWVASSNVACCFQIGF